jgi:hypothetical protein
VSPDALKKMGETKLIALFSLVGHGSKLQVTLDN